MTFLGIFFVFLCEFLCRGLGGSGGPGRRPRSRGPSFVDIFCDEKLSVGLIEWRDPFLRADKNLKKSIEISLDLW